MVPSSPAFHASLLSGAGATVLVAGVGASNRGVGRRHRQFLAEMFWLHFYFG